MSFRALLTHSLRNGELQSVGYVAEIDAMPVLMQAGVMTTLSFAHVALYRNFGEATTGSLPSPWLGFLLFTAMCCARLAYGYAKCYRVMQSSVQLLSAQSHSMLQLTLASIRIRKSDRSDHLVRNREQCHFLKDVYRYLQSYLVVGCEASRARVYEALESAENGMEWAQSLSPHLNKKEMSHIITPPASDTSNKGGEWTIDVYPEEDANMKRLRLVEVWLHRAIGKADRKKYLTEAQAFQLYETLEKLRETITKLYDVAGPVTPLHRMLHSMGFIAIVLYLFLFSILAAPFYAYSTCLWVAIVSVILFSIVRLCAILELPLHRDSTLSKSSKPMDTFRKSIRECQRGLETTFQAFLKATGLDQSFLAADPPTSVHGSEVSGRSRSQSGTSSVSSATSSQCRRFKLGINAEPVGEKTKLLDGHLAEVDEYDSIPDTKQDEEGDQIAV